MSRIKNLSRAGWMIVGIVVTLILVPTGAAMATIANAGIEARSAYKANVPPGLQLLTNAVTSGNTFPSTASFTDSRHELRMAGQARETGGVDVRGSSSIGGSVEFDDSSFEVLPGSLVSLHWSTFGSGAPTSPNLHFLVTSSLPGFSSTSVVTWPPGTSPSPTWTTSTGWMTTADAMTVVIPGDAAAGTQYTVALITCDSTGCSSPAQSAVLTVPPSPTSWVTRSYQSNYSHLATNVVLGQPFATTFLTSDNSIWIASEFSHDLTEIKSNGTSGKRMGVTTPHGAPHLFLQPFAACGISTCHRTARSAQSEQVITAGGKIWLTFGGWRWYQSSASPPNHSEVVAFDPATKKFCTYLLPGNNNEVAGIATTGAGTDLRVWFVESRGSGGQPSLDGFDPSAVGGGCDGDLDEAYVLPESVRLLKWPSTGGQWPVQIAVDPTSPTLWITDFNGYDIDGEMHSDIDQVDISDPAEPRVESRYVIPSANPSSLLGPKPWDIAAPANSNYVYATDNGDAEIVRINKLTGQMDELPIPLTSDVESGFGLAISSGRLYFTLADDYVTNFGAASTFGYIDLSSWPQGTSHADGVIYTGLPTVTNSGFKADYRAIAVGPTGQVAITDKHGMIRLTP